MTRKWGFVFLTLLIFSACTSPTNIPSLPNTLVVTQTARPLFTSTPTKISQSFTRTPRPLPSTTPTFDVASIVTQTAAPPEQCPAPVNVPLPDLSIDSNDFFTTFPPRDEDVLAYLNQGGDPNKLLAEYKHT